MPQTSADPSCVGSAVSVRLDACGAYVPAALPVFVVAAQRSAAVTCTLEADETWKTGVL